jgi:hypothetical protein
VYWPKVRGKVTIVPSGAEGGFVEAGSTSEGAEDLLQRTGCSVEELAAAYYFLVERGLRREPHDGMVMLRRSVPREYHVRWRGNVRQAQDHFDAAQMLRLWLTDLTGHAPERPESWPLDGRQADRMALYERGPALRVMDEDLKRELISIELYPHGPLVIGEGASERIIIDWLLQALLGLRGAFRFHDLEGGGGAIRISQLLDSFEGYPTEAFVVADNEGDTKRYVTVAIAGGKIDEDNVLLAEDSIEHDNFTLTELIEVAQELAAHPPEGREAVSFELTVDRLREEHASRRDRRPRDRPGIADTLLDLIERPEYGTVRISKPELAEGLARLLVGELSRAEGREGLLEITERRPIVRFVIDHICPVLNPPRPAS